MTPSRSSQGWGVLFREHSAQQTWPGAANGVVLCPARHGLEVRRLLGGHNPGACMHCNKGIIGLRPESSKFEQWPCLYPWRYSLSPVKSDVHPPVEEACVRKATLNPGHCSGGCMQEGPLLTSPIKGGLHLWPAPTFRDLALFSALQQLQQFQS